MLRSVAAVPIGRWLDGRQWLADIVRSDGRQASSLVAVSADQRTNGLVVLLLGNAMTATIATTLVLATATAAAVGTRIL